MKRKTLYVSTLALALAGAFLLGKSMHDKEKYLNMETIIDYNATDTGLMLYTADGNGYYWEMNEAK